MTNVSGIPCCWLWGGSEDIENIKIVKTIPYIDICTQTIGEFEVADKY